jgi:peptide-methionine (S)-S-oxide reductase
MKINLMKKILSSAYGIVALLLAGYCSAGDTPPSVKPASAPLATAEFAGGCFWCTEADFEKLTGVVKAESGYSGGRLKNPTYEQVSRGGTGHAESVLVTYDPKQVTYEKLLDYFWHSIDPTVKDQQFCDIGEQYRSVIFYQNDAQKKAAEASKAALERSKKFTHIYTEIIPASRFYLAEDYHQDYYKKNPIRYKFYRNGCGRDARINEIWGEMH